MDKPIDQPMDQQEMYTVAVANQTARHFLHQPKNTDSYWEFLIFTKPNTGNTLVCLRQYSTKGTILNQLDELGLEKSRDCWNWLVNAHNAKTCGNPFRQINH